MQCEPSWRGSWVSATDGLSGQEYRIKRTTDGHAFTVHDAVRVAGKWIAQRPPAVWVCSISRSIARSASLTRWG